VLICRLITYSTSLYLYLFDLLSLFQKRQKIVKRIYITFRQIFFPLFFYHDLLYFIAIFPPFYFIMIFLLSILSRSFPSLFYCNLSSFLLYHNLPSLLFYRDLSSFLPYHNLSSFLLYCDLPPLYFITIFPPFWKNKVLDKYLDKLDKFRKYLDKFRQNFRQIFWQIRQILQTIAYITNLDDFRQVFLTNLDDTLTVP